MLSPLQEAQIKPPVEKAALAFAGAVLDEEEERDRLQRERARRVSAEVSAWARVPTGARGRQAGLGARRADRVCLCRPEDSLPRKAESVDAT